jgi:hypothetical protein
VIVSALILGGCSINKALMPSEQRIQTLPWLSYSEMKLAYDRIVPSAPDTDTYIWDAEKLGFALAKVSGAEEWSPTKVRQHFLGKDQTSALEHLEGGERLCVEKHATGRVFPIKFTETRGEGSWLKRELDSEKRDRTRGSEAWVFICYNPRDGRIIAKTIDEKPFVDDTKIKKDPFGPARKAIKLFTCPWCF